MIIGHRIRILVVFACAILATANFTPIYGQKTNGQSSSDWPGFLGIARDSKSTETGILKDWSAGKLKTAWSIDAGKGYVLGAVAEGNFFQFDAIDKNCRLICRDAATGEEKWKFEYPFQYKDMFEFDEGPRATPLVNDKRVYIYGVEGMLHCLDTSDGSVIWKKNVSREFGVVQNFFGVGSTPIIHDRYLIVMVGGSPAEDQNPTGGRLDSISPNGTAVVVLDKKTGEVLHKLGDDLASYSSVQLYKNENEMFGVAWLRANVIGFDFRTGNQLWSHRYRARRYETVNAATPVVQGSEILLSESYGLGSILLDVSENKPKIVWNDSNPRKQSLASHWNTPVLHEGCFYACHGSGRANSEIRCIDWKTGEVKWGERGYGRSSLTYVDGHFIVLDENGELLLIKASPEKFELVTKYRDQMDEKLPIEYPCWAAPIVANGMLYVRGKNKIVCLKVKS